MSCLNGWMVKSNLVISLVPYLYWSCKDYRVSKQPFKPCTGVPRIVQFVWPGKKPYYAKFVLIESISTSTVFTSKSSTCTIQVIQIFIKKSHLHDHIALFLWSWYASLPFHNRVKIFKKSYCNFILLKLHMRGILYSF